MEMGFYIRLVPFHCSSSWLTMYDSTSVNGCSLKTEDNLNSARTIRLDRLLLETGSYSASSFAVSRSLTSHVDAPWCSMTGGHASKQHLASIPAPLRELYFPASTKPDSFVLGKAVKGRNEPCAIGGVAWVMHQLHDIPFEKITEDAFQNTIELFNLDV
jgi:TatD DNase family protein